MSDALKSGRAAEQAIAIDETSIRERILKNAVTVAAWATVCLFTERNASGDISELYVHYQDYCRRESHVPLVRKTWVAAMKLAGFQTDSGAFIGLSIR